MTSAQIKHEIAVTSAQIGETVDTLKQLGKDQADMERLAARQKAVRNTVESDLQARTRRLNRAGIDPARVRSFAGYHAAMSSKLAAGSKILAKLAKASDKIAHARDDIESQIHMQTVRRGNLQDHLTWLHSQLASAEAAEAAEKAAKAGVAA